MCQPVYFPSHFVKHIKPNTQGRCVRKCCIPVHRIQPFIHFTYKLLLTKLIMSGVTRCSFNPFYGFPSTALTLIKIRAKYRQRKPIYRCATLSKVKLSCYRHTGDKGDRMYSSYSFLTSAVDGGQCHAPVALYTRGKDHRYPLDRRLDGPQSWSGHRG
jgi:hypothetical protein